MIKTKKIETVVEETIDRQWPLFWTSIVASVLLTSLFVYLTENEYHEVFVGTIGLFWFFGVYFLPTILSYDLISYYQGSHNAPHIKNRNAFIITVLNLVLGWTGIVWIICLLMATKLGTVTFTRVEYIEIES